MNWPAFATFVHHHWGMLIFLSWIARPVIDRQGHVDLSNVVSKKKR